MVVKFPTLLTGYCMMMKYSISPVIISRIFFANRKSIMLWFMITYWMKRRKMITITKGLNYVPKNIGNLVYKQKFARDNKLDIIYDGPYEIMRKINNLCYQIRLCENEKAPLILANVRQLKPFIDENPEISTAVKTRQMIKNLAKEDQSVTRARRRVLQDDDNYLDDAHLDWLLNGNISTEIP